MRGTNSAAREDELAPICALPVVVLTQICFTWLHLKFCFFSFLMTLWLGTSSSSGGPVSLSLSPFRCMHCFKAFSTTAQMNQHLLVHSGERKHHCSFCEKAFKQLSHLQQHTRRHTGEQKHHCSYCVKSFNQLSHLQQHTRRHTGVYGLGLSYLPYFKVFFF